MAIKKIFQYQNFNIYRTTFGAAVFLQLNTIVNYIDEVWYRFMRNIIGLGKGTPKSRFMLTITNCSI